MKKDRYFKKPNGVIIKYASNHDLKSLKDRFLEVDKFGKEIKKVAKKKAVKRKKGTN